MIAFRTNSCVPRKAQVYKFEILADNQNSLTPPPILSTVQRSAWWAAIAPARTNDGE
jgi:hypothetical protein